MATEKKASGHEKVDQWNRQVSPLLQIVSQFKGGQAVYAVAFSYFIILIASKCVLLLFSEKEKVAVIDFFYRQFNSISYFIQLFALHHSIVYIIVYPALRFGRQSEVLLKLTALLTLALCKLAIYFIVYRKDDSSATIRSACAFESTRIMMKIISFLYEGHVTRGHEKGTSSISLGKLTYFLFAPTLIYSPNYARTHKPINWRAFVLFLTEFVVIVLVYALWVKDIFTPALASHYQIVRSNSEEAMSSYIRIFPFFVTNCILLVMAIGFGFLHSYLNAWAELLTFSERTFYQDWWVNSGPDETFRKWNRLVGSFLHRYFYTWLLSRQFSRKTSVAVVFVISGLYHDYIMGIITCRWIPSFTLYLLVCALASFLSPRIRQIEYTQYMLTGSTIAFCLLGFMSMSLFH